MAKERIVSARETGQDDPVAVGSVRPQRLVDFVGQRELVERLTIALEAVRVRGESMEHVLLHGPPGLGKTTLAHVIAEEMGTRAYVTSGPAMTKGADLVGTLTKMQAGDILFIDEIHRLPIAVEEYIYSAMEDFKIDFTLDAGLHAKVITYRIQPFCLIGATTRAGLLTGALRSRFGIVHHLRYYDAAELTLVVRHAARRLGADTITDGAVAALAARSRGTPRIAIRLLRRARDFALVRGNGTIDAPTVTEALALEGVDERGLDRLDRAYLAAIARVYDGGPVGLEAVAATLGEDADTLEDVVEPFLLQQGLLARTRSGRCLTEDGRVVAAAAVEEARPAVAVESKPRASARTPHTPP